MATIDKYAYFKKIGYEPHSPAQHSYHQSKARFRVPCCGRRFGKSTMAGTDLEPKLFVPKSQYWIVGPTYDLGEKEFRVVWNDLIINMQFGRDKRVKKAYNKKQGNMFIELPWQTRLEVRSADHPENLVGEALDGVIMSEAAKQKKETWERFIRPALSDKRGFADFPTTPEGYNWLHELWQFGQNPNRPEYASWNFPSWANIKVYPGGRNDPEIKQIEQDTAPEWFMQEIGAEFGAFVGKIFPEWNEQTHVIDNYTFNPNWPNYGCFDWGYTNPLAFVEFQVSPQDEIFVWREHYKAYATLADHFHIIKSREQPLGYHLDLTFGDAADPEAIETVNQNFSGCMGDPAAKENWRQGIDLMRRFMKMRSSSIEIDEFGTPADDKPGFFVDRNCNNLIRELNNYRAKNPVKGQNVPEMGQKIDDHAIDALRYGVMHVFELGAQHHLHETLEPTQPSSSSELPSDGGFFTTGGEF